MRTCIRLIAVFVLFWAPQAAGQSSIIMTLDSPIVTGQEFHPRIQTVGMETETDCSPWTITCYGDIDWGDGSWSRWWWDSDWGGGMDPEVHAYKLPGRYCVTASRYWTVKGVNPDDDCAITSGSHKTTTIVDVLPAGDPPENGWLGVFYDREATICSTPGLAIRELYVVAGLAGATSNGLAGAAFRLVGPKGFLYLVDPEPEWIALGDVFGDGITMAASCDLSEGLTQVPLLRITALYRSGNFCGNLKIEDHLKPTNPNQPGVTFILCDEPTFTAIEGAKWYGAHMSPSGEEWTCQSNASPTSVESGTWTKIKTLYR